MGCSANPAGLRSFHARCHKYRLWSRYSLGTQVPPRGYWFFFPVRLLAPAVLSSPFRPGPFHFCPVGPNLIKFAVKNYQEGIKRRDAFPDMSNRAETWPSQASRKSSVARTRSGSEQKRSNKHARRVLSSPSRRAIFFASAGEFDLRRLNRGDRRPNPKKQYPRHQQDHRPPRESRPSFH